VASAFSPQPSALDDRTVAYVVESQPLFEDLRQVAAQLAGLLVLAATGSREATPGHPMLEAAERLFKQTADGIAHARPSERARVHHDSLREAVRAIGAALTGARPLLAATNRADVDAVLVPLRDGYSHLQRAAGALPGFRMVAFEQGCCAGAHATHSAGVIA
jgi:hypothetical protein